ncbi:MAG: polyprenyl synthetase family protein [Ardenticatenaceae bacterium]|nr:polyprenyl synthetase family protein [Ardenticatenaceae bacterium]
MIDTLCDSIVLFDDVIDDEIDAAEWQDRFPYAQTTTIARASAVNVASVLLGLACLDLAKIKPFYSCSQTAAEEIQQQFFQAFIETSIGQQMSVGLTPHSLAEAWQIAEQKSCPFYQFAAWSGARLATDDHHIHQQFLDFGRLVGLIIQISDDVNDLWVDGEKKGDIAAGIISLPIAYTLSVLQNEALENFKTLLKEASHSTDKEAEAYDVIINSGALQYLRIELYSLTLKASAILNSIGNEENTVEGKAYLSEISGIKNFETLSI